MKKNKKKEQVKQKSEELVQEFRQSAKKSNSDVLGSYTGVSKKGESPEQDADDL